MRSVIVFFSLNNVSGTAVNIIYYIKKKKAQLGGFGFSASHGHYIQERGEMLISHLNMTRSWEGAC